jgi:hypothetical protein
VTVAEATSLVAPVVIMQPQAATLLIDGLSQPLRLARASCSAPHSSGPTETAGPAEPVERQ